MADLPWSKFFWSDWTSDDALKQCSLAAQGLWMRMLCICAKGDPIGYLTINGNPLDASGVAISAGVSMDEAESLMAELDRWGVFSRDRNGRIYSRRMVRDAARSAKARKNGKMGGNPSLGNQKENSKSLKGHDKGEDKTQKPEARSQSIEFDKSNSCPTFSDFWLAWPAKIGKQKAEAAWRRLSQQRREAALGAVNAGWFDAWRKAHPDATPIHPATFLNGGRWEDERDVARSSAISPHETDRRIAETIREGKRFLVTNVSASKARDLIAEGYVTEAQCRAVGVL